MEMVLDNTGQIINTLKTGGGILRKMKEENVKEGEEYVGGKYSPQEEINYLNRLTFNSKKPLQPFRDKIEKEKRAVGDVVEQKDSEKQPKQEEQEELLKSKKQKKQSSFKKRVEQYIVI